MSHNDTPDSHGVHDAHDEHDLGPTGEDAIEPDETPDRFLIMVGGALTVSVIVAVFIGMTLFNSTLASERAAKGYAAPTITLSR